MLLTAPPLIGENGPNSTEHVRPHNSSVPYGKLFAFVELPSWQGVVSILKNSTVKLSRPRKVSRNFLKKKRRKKKAKMPTSEKKTSPQENSIASWIIKVGRRYPDRNRSRQNSYGTQLKGSKDIHVNSTYKISREIHKSAAITGDPPLTCTEARTIP